MPKHFFYGLRAAHGVDHLQGMRAWSRLFAWDNRDLNTGRTRARLDAQRFGIALEDIQSIEYTGNSSVTTHKAFAKSLATFTLPSAVVDHFTPSDVLTVIFHPEWVEGTEYEFFHNGVKIDEDRARELIG